MTPKWPVHTAYGKEFLTLDTNNTSIGVGPRLEQCAFWKNYIPDVAAISSRVDLNEFSFDHSRRVVQFIQFIQYTFFFFFCFSREYEV